MMVSRTAKDVLMCHPDITKAAVVEQDRSDGTIERVAFVEIWGHIDVDLDSIRDWANAQLAPVHRIDVVRTGD